MTSHMRTAPAGGRGGGIPDDVGIGQCDISHCNRFPPKFKSLAAVVAFADAMAAARRVIHVCRCPNCGELLILPERPYAVALPDAEESAS